MPLFAKVTCFCISTFLTRSKGKLKQELEEVIKLCKEVHLFQRLWQVFYNGIEIVPQKFKIFESTQCWNLIPYTDSLMGLSRVEIVVLAGPSVQMTLTVSSKGWVLAVALIHFLKFQPYAGFYGSQKKRNILELSIFGDSKVVIDWDSSGLTNLQSVSDDCQLKRIGLLKNCFLSLSFRHLYREFNSDADLRC